MDINRYGWKWVKNFQASDFRQGIRQFDNVTIRQCEQLCQLLFAFCQLKIERMEMY